MGQRPDARLPLPAAVLWDMDGTLVDTEPYWLAAQTELVAEHGSTWTPEQGLQLVGKSLLSSAAIIIAATGIPLEPPEVVAECLARVVDQVRRSGAVWRPGVRELLTELAEHGVPSAVVTSSYRSLAEEVVAAAGFEFGAVVTGDGVTHGKPHPEPYLTAARQLGVASERCVAVEDSTVGVAAAMASGARTIAVPLMVPVPAQPGLSRLPSLEGIDAGVLARVAAGEVLDEVPG